jgi:hypothetical protein
MAPIQLTRGVAVGVELKNLKKVVLAEKIRLGHFPTPSEFREAVQRFYADATTDPLLDPWNHHYQYNLLGRDVFEIRCVGPDARRETNDDIVIR